MKPSEFADRLGQFLSVYLPATRKVSVNTIRSYRDAFALLLRFLRDQRAIPVEKVSLDHLDAPTLIEWLDHLENARQCSPRSRNQRMSAIRSFLRYLAPSDPARVQQLHRVLAIPSCRCRREPVAYLEPNLVAALLAQPDLSTPRGRRDAVLLSVLYDTGARSQEIVDLRVRDLRLDSPAQATLTGKGRRTRIVPLMPSTVRLLRDYLRSTGLDRPGAGNEPAFAGRNGSGLTRSGLRSILAKHADAARASHPALAERLGPHTLRHYPESRIMRSYDQDPAVLTANLWRDGAYSSA